jgi:choline kinase
MSLKERKGLILAAGYGSRLEGVSAVTAFKPLTPVLGEPLIFRTITSLEKAGCTGIVIVLGHGHEEVRKAILDAYEGDTPLEFIYNEKYNLSNGVSVLSAKEQLSDEFIMTMADHVIGDSLMEIAGDYDLEPGSAALLVDYKVDSIFDMDDATKVLSKDDKITSIGKEIEEFNCIDTGVFVCTKGIMGALEKKYQEEGDTSISDGVQKLASSGMMYTVDIKDGFWQDVDTPEMLEYVEQILSEA